MTHPLIEKMREAAAEKPDYIAKTKYVVDGEPECIVGVALAKLGVTVEELQGLQAGSISCPTVKAATVQAFLEERFGVDANVLQWVFWVQRRQDQAEPWGMAVRRADDRG